MPLEIAVGLQMSEISLTFWYPDCYGVCRPVEMQQVKFFITDLVKSLKRWEPIQASEHPHNLNDFKDLST